MGIKARQRLAGVEGIRRDARQLVLHYRGNADNAGSLATLGRIFQRDGDDLVCEIEVPMTASALGCSLDVETFDGRRTIDVEPGTDSGHVISLKGLGVGRLNRPGRGDLKVVVEVKTPSKVDDAQRALLQQLAKLRGEELPAARVVQHSSSFFSKLRERIRS